ncbi:MAG: hypothetical protein IT436_17920 [Phycisphaerales bacterium]|nr:hypothetical protein [Phycisphaerales bacterium]
MDSRLNAFERRVLDLIAHGDTDDARVLRAQAAAARVVSRSAGPGYGADFVLPEEAPRFASRDARVAILGGVVEGPNGAGPRVEGAGFILHIVDGQMSMLEGIGGKAWPGEPVLARHWYHQRSRDGLRVMPG